MGRQIIVVSVIVVMAAGCSGEDEGAATCVPGTTQECVCPSLAAGVQVCADEGRFAECVCSGDDSDLFDLQYDGPDVSTQDGVDGSEEDVVDADENDTDDIDTDDIDTDDIDMDENDTLDVYLDQTVVDLDEDAPVPLDGTVGIRIELTWDTPGDDTHNEGAGQGADLDLHLLHPDGMWDGLDDLHWDCHWKDRNPEWGDGENLADDPNLVQDDVDGWGPEILVFPQPSATEESPLEYRIGVFYFTDNAFGPSHATIEVFVDNVSQAIITRDEILARQFWEAASIRWPYRSAEEDIVEIDELYEDGIPGFTPE